MQNIDIIAREYLIKNKIHNCDFSFIEIAKDTYSVQNALLCQQVYKLGKAASISFEELANNFNNVLSTFNKIKKDRR